MAIKAGIIGGAGYAGIELVRLLIEHPDFDLTVVTSNADSGELIADAYPAFTGVTDLAFSRHDDPRVRECDAVFLSVPHTASMGYVPGLLQAGVTAIDLSADFRLKDRAVYEKWYAPHTAPSLLARASFGQPETCGDELRSAALAHAAGDAVLVACAGCYPTATALASFPAVKFGLTRGPIVVDAISGITGAGKKATPRTHFCASDESLEAYAVGAHRHTPEIEQILGMPGEVIFTPHLAPLKRGLLSTVTMMLSPEARDMPIDEIQSIYEGFYQDSPFVQVLAQGSQPKTASVLGSNRAQVSVSRHPANALIAVGAIDNLCKGAASQAVQCANIVFGLAEDKGLAKISNPV